MALFHQIRRADPMEEARQKQEKFFEGLKNVDMDGTALNAGLKRGRKPDPNAKQLLTLRLDPQVIEHFRATGDGWQTRMNEALRKAAGLTAP